MGEMMVAGGGFIIIFCKVCYAAISWLNLISFSMLAQNKVRYI